MERIIFKYSQFFDDDGAFEQAEQKINDFGKRIVESAKKTSEDFKKNLNLENVEALEKYENDVNLLVEAQKKQQKATSDLQKIQEEYLKQIKKNNTTDQEQIDNLTKLDKQLQEYRTNLKELNKFGTIQGKVVKDVNKARVQEQLNIKKVSKEIREQQKELLKQNELSTKEKKLIQARLVLQKEEVNTRGEIKERIAAINTVIDNSIAKTDEEKKAIQDLIAEQEELRKQQADLSDSYTKNKINVGNYEEGIINALKSTSFFSGELEVLNKITEKAIGFFEGSKKANEEDSKAKDKNKKSTNGLRKGISSLNKVAKATFILALVAAISSLASVFTQGRRGAILQAQAIARLQVFMKSLIDVGAKVGSGLLKIFSSLATSFGSFSDKIKLYGLEVKKFFLELTNIGGRNKQELSELATSIAEVQKKLDESEPTKYGEGWDEIKNAVLGVGDAYEKAKKSIKTLDDAAIKAFKIKDEIRASELALIDLRREVQELEIESEDSTKSLLSQLNATDKLLTKRLEALREEQRIAGNNLQLANVQGLAEAQRLGYVGKVGDSIEEQVAFAQKLLKINQGLKPQENSLTDSFLEESQQALRNYLELQNQVVIAEKETAKQRREIQRDLFEQNLDLLIDLIDTEKNANEQFVNDTTINFQDRLKEFNAFVVKFRQNTQKQLDEFNKQLETKNIDLDFEIEYDADGNFEVFLGDQKLATDNIVELNKQLQKTGLSEIEVNRFREFLIETRNGVKDFRDLNKELTEAGIKFRQLRSDVGISENEVQKLAEVNKKIIELREKSSGRLSKKQREEVVKQLEELEKERENISSKADERRTDNRLKAIDEELKLVREKEAERLRQNGDLSEDAIDLLKDENQRVQELLEERNSIEKKLREESINDQIKSEKEKQRKIIEEQKKAEEEMRAVFNKILDAAVESQKKRVEGAEEATDRQRELVSKQEERARQGLENTLAFEQRELGKREAERIRQQEELERREKIKALYSSYSNYASQGDGDNAIVKALRDFAILEAITASFGEGGIIEDEIGKVPTNGKGIIRGRTHQGRQGGIPVLVEGQEGIFSKNEMRNLGKENFYKMKEIASLGKVDSNFFERQRKELVVKTESNQGYSSEVVSKLDSLKKTIENKPVSSFDVRSLSKTMSAIIETTKTKNSTRRTIHPIKKSRL